MGGMRQAISTLCASKISSIFRCTFGRRINRLANANECVLNSMHQGDSMPGKIVLIACALVCLAGCGAPKKTALNHSDLQHSDASPQVETKKAPNQFGWDDNNCAHIMADGHCAHPK
jgi:hypothetical protein